METFDDKIFFKPGDVVILRQDLDYKPKMLVTRKETNLFTDKNYLNCLLKGIRCRWFTKDGSLLEATFNTKDLIKI